MEQRRISLRNRGAGKIGASIKRPGKVSPRAFFLFLVFIVQVSLLALCPVLRWLCEERAGVMKHVYYRSVQLRYGIMSDGNMTLLSLVALLSALVLIYFAFTRRGRLSRFCLAEILWGACLGLFLASVTAMRWSTDHVAYRYVVMTAFWPWIIQLAPLLTCRRKT